MSMFHGVKHTRLSKLMILVLGLYIPVIHCYTYSIAEPLVPYGNTEIYTLTALTNVFKSISTDSNIS